MGIDYKKAYKNLAAKIKNAHLFAQTDSTKNVLEDILPELRESEDERMIRILKEGLEGLTVFNYTPVAKILSWLEKQKETSKAIEAIERIDKYIDEHVANAHDMKDSNPDKKYYCGVDDTLSNIAGILQGVYAKQKESLHIPETCKENAGSFTDEDEDRTINGCLLAANAECRCKRASEELLEELGLADYTKFFYEQGVEKGKKEREKQKEQRPLPGFDDLTPEEKMNHPLYLEGFDTGREVGRVEAEQKPTEWSEEDEANLDYLIDFCNSYYNGSTRTLTESAARTLSNWLYRVKSGEIIELAEEGIISHDGRRYCWHQVELLPEPVDEVQPSLPSNLDEAAEEYGRNTFINECMENGVCDDHDLSDAFKAGAEWMAGQGYTFETIMQEDEVDELVPTCPDMYNHGYSYSEKVIVQIRKKH